ncbi:MAG: hypothetical protein LBJ23_07065, partial [Tannerella sp.]|nr:hypothetical protein [Tannerella sp.]
MEKDKDSAINFFKEKIIRIYKPLKIAQIGSNRKVKDKTDDYDCKSDFDMIVVVDDKLDCYEYMKQISSV